MGLAVAAGFLMCVPLWPADAQRADGLVDQVQAGASDAAQPIEQVSEGRRNVTAPAPDDVPPVTPLPQLSSPEEAGEGVRQISSGDEPAKTPPQLYSGGKTALPPQPLSRPSDGRTGAMAPVEGGEDACDPADAEEAKVEVCERVIETRSAEFVRPDPTALSPEQRLIIQQRLREGPASGAQVTRRLATEGDADSLEGLGVASIVLNRPAAPETRPDDPLEDPAADAATAAILEIIAQGGNVTTPQ